jgi:hypothetical protein
VPRQRTTGGKPKLLRISKRGNTYLRTLFIHGAPGSNADLGQKRDAARPMAAWAQRQGHIAMSPSWRSPISWRGSPGAVLKRGRAFQLSSVAMAG